VLLVAGRRDLPATCAMSFHRCLRCRALERSQQSQEHVERSKRRGEETVRERKRKRDKEEEREREREKREERRGKIQKKQRETSRFFILLATYKSPRDHFVIVRVPQHLFFRRQSAKETFRDHILEESDLEGDRTQRGRDTSIPMSFASRRSLSYRTH
jgi:hypothetical protein